MPTREIKNGIYGGLVGGLVFGVMMGMMGMLPMIGQMVGRPFVLDGLIVHLGISAILGATFALAVHWSRLHAGTGVGLGDGLLWWLIGPLTLMPLFMGMGFGVNWNVAALAQALPSLVGHLVFGGLLGWTYARLSAHASDPVARRHQVTVA